MSLDTLYRRVLMEHARSPRNRGRVEHETTAVELSNPSCGDIVRLSLEVRDGKIHDAKFTGEGCSISMASASMMTEAIHGLPVERAREVLQLFSRWLQGEEVDLEEFPVEEIAALGGVHRFPARIKCAMLAWDALRKSFSAPPPAQER